MKIQITASVFIDGIAKDAGEIVDVADGIGRELIGTNRAVAYVAPVPAAPAADDAPASS